MEPALVLETLKGLIQTHWWSAFFLLVTLTTVLTFMGLAWWLRRRFRKMLEQKFQDETELDELPPLGPQDLEALGRIKQLRREIWDLPESELQLNVEALNLRAVKVVRSIAAVYYPDSPNPQFEAGLIDLLGLARRVSARLARVSCIGPFRILGNRKISEYQRYYMMYRKINENPVVGFFKKNPILFRMTRWAVNIRNIANPLYWAGRELSKESYFMALRWFYLTMVGQVGREAMRVFSGRRFQKEEDREIVLICYKLFVMVSHWGGPDPSEWALLVSHIAGHPALEDETKVQVLSRISEGKLPKGLEEREIKTSAGLRWYRDGLKLLLKGDKRASPAKTHLLREELAAVKKTFSPAGRDRAQSTRGES